MAVTPRTRAGFVKVRSAGPGSRVAVVAPASPFRREEFDNGIRELRRLGFDPVFDESVFDREAIVAGSAARRAEAFMHAMTRADVDLVIAVRGGYGSVDLLALLDPDRLTASRTAFVGYSDLTSVHAFLQGRVGMTSIHGPMLAGRLGFGAAAYDEVSWLGSLRPQPVGELAPEGLEVLRSGEATGPIVGGTIVQLASSLGTPFAFAPPDGAVIFLEDVDERPYRIRRSLTQLRLAGALAGARALVFGQMRGCDEPSGALTARAVVADCTADFDGPVLYGFPSGHCAGPFVSLPFGVDVRVVADSRAPRLVIEEAAAA